MMTKTEISVELTLWVKTKMIRMTLSTEVKDYDWRSQWEKA